jgi:hypothetical protein
LDRTASGYALRLAPDATDAARFTRDVEEGRGGTHRDPPALAWFQQLEDVTFALTALDTGATALAVAGRVGDAARLRAAVHHHAARLGMPGRRWPTDLVADGRPPLQLN